MRRIIKVTKITQSRVSEMYKNSIEFGPRYIFTVPYAPRNLEIILGTMYRENRFSAYIFQTRSPSRPITTVVIPCHREVMYEVGNDGFIHSFDGIDGLYWFLGRTSLKYSEAKKTFLDKVVNHAFWPYNADVLSVLSQKINRIMEV